MRSDGLPTSSETDALVLAASKIADDLISFCSPSEEAVFSFAVCVASAARAPEPRAVRLAFELAAGLLDNVPAGRAWSETRGRLWATKLFAWVLLQTQPAVANAREVDADAPAEPEMHVSRASFGI